MKIYVIRHGVTPLNKLKKVNGEVDESLDPEGVEQAKEAVALIPQTIIQIYVSPLLRAQQTANILSESLHLPISIENGLTEIRMGSLAGKAWEEMENGAELKQKHRSVQFDYHPYGGESLEEVKKRLLVFLNTLKKKHSDREILLITHGGIIRMIRLFESGTVVDETEKHVSLLEFDLDQILQRT
jgi:broad specificity phosphatase PhoE